MRTHMTKDRVLIPISEMEDEHLINTIKLHIRTLKDAKTFINQEAVDKFTAAINGQKDSSAMKENAIRYAADFHERMSTYIFEAMIRELDIDELMADIQSLLGRKGAVIRSHLTALPESLEDDELPF